MKSIVAAVVITLFASAAVVNADADAKKNMISRTDAIFGLHFDFHASQYDKEIGANISEDNIRMLVSKVRPDFVQYDCKGHGGYTSYPTKVGTPSPGIIKDALPIWRKVTNEFGTKLFIHYSGVLDGVAVEKHPEWARLDKDGNSDGMTTSVFSSYVDDLLIPQLREVSTAYQLDGMWVDGECWGVKLDYSPAAIEAWKNETGYTDVPKSSADPHWAEWKNFHRRKFEQYLIHWSDALYETHPNLEITSNWAYTSMMPKPIAANLDYISGDYQPLNSLDSARLEARYLSSVDRPWDLMAWGFSLPGDIGQTFKTPVQLQQEAAVVLMQGGAFQIYYQPTRPGYVINDIIETAAKVANFCRDRKSFSRHSKSVPQVAVLFPTETLADQANEPYPPMDYREINGALHALLESGYSVDLLPEFILQPMINQYPLIVIPDSYKLTDTFITIVTRYVENGGNLLLLGEKCARLFKPILGVEFIGEPGRTSAEVLTSAGIVNESGVWQSVKTTTAESFANRYLYKDTNRDGETAATIASYGKGKVGAVYGPVCLNFANTHHPYLRTFIGDMASAMFKNPAVKIEGPAYIDISLRKTEDGKLSLHMLNTLNMQDANNRVSFDYIPAVRNIKVKMKVDNEPQKVRWMPEGKQLKWKWDNGIMTTTVPELHIHGAVVID